MQRYGQCSTQTTLTTNFVIANEIVASVEILLKMKSDVKLNIILMMFESLSFDSLSASHKNIGEEIHYKSDKFI